MRMWFWPKAAENFDEQANSFNGQKILLGHLVKMYGNIYCPIDYARFYSE